MDYLSFLPTPILKSLKMRNAFFDHLFYDVNVLSQTEKDSLSPIYEGEGALIIVPPSESGREITQCITSDELLQMKGQNGKPLKDQIQAVALAGVGSSVWGTAALARNVANVYNIDVLGIVTGFGAADILEEALEGWFFYGAADQIQYNIRKTMDFWQDLMTPPKSAQTKARGVLELAEKPEKRVLKKRYEDIKELKRLLIDANLPNLKMLVGHSKGALLINHAAEELVLSNSPLKEKYFKELKLVTLGAVTDLPPQFEEQYQFIGSLDWFGGMNSRPDVYNIKVPMAWHHLNEALPYHLSVENALKENVSLD